MNTHTPTEKQTLKTAGRPGQECAAFFLGERKQGQGAQARVILRKEAIPLERERRQNPRGKVHPRFLSLVRAFKCLWLMKLLGRTRMTTGSLGRTVFRRISKLEKTSRAFALSQVTQQKTVRISHFAVTQQGLLSPDSVTQQTFAYIILRFILVLLLYVFGVRFVYVSSSSLDTDLWMVVSCHRGAGNPSQLFWKSSKCFQPLSHISRQADIF